MKWVLFETDTQLKAKALINDAGELIEAKLITHVPRGYYYSCLNEVLLTAEKLFNNERSANR